jgi:hypothetical protein
VPGVGAGAMAAGEFDVSITSSLPGLVGSALYIQLAVIDPAATGGFALTQGLELIVGQ